MKNKDQNNKNKNKKQPTSKNTIQFQKYVKPGMSLDDVIKLKQCFDIFDQNKGGTISPQQLKTAIIALGLESQAQKILGLVKTYTQDSQSDEIDFDGFMELFGFNSDLKSQNNLTSLFQHFDKEKKGHINFQDFKVIQNKKRICQMLGERYSDNQIHQMIEHADLDKDGVINYQQFVAVITKQYPQV